MSGTVKKTGRPLGAKTAQREVIERVTLIDPCPKCQSRKEPATKKWIRSGSCNKVIQGQKCVAYVHHTCVCADCGQAFLMKTFTSE